MHDPASRRQPSARSRSTRTLSSTDSSPVNSKVHLRAVRGLGKVVSGVIHDASGAVHDVSDVGHDVGHVIGDALSGKFSKVGGDIAQTEADVSKAGADAAKAAEKAANGVVDQLRNAFKPPGTAGSGPGSQTHGNGSDGGTQTGPDPRPTTAPGSGGGAAPQSSQHVSSPAPSSVSPADYSTPHSSAYSTPIPSNPTLSNSPGNGGSNAVPTQTHLPSSSDSVLVLASSGGSPEDGRTVDGVAHGPLSTASATHSTSTMDPLPSSGSGGSGSGAHRKGFPLAAAAAIGSVLGFLVVSALFWAVWLYLRKRRRAFHAVYLPPRRMLSLSSGCTVSTVPLFISASEAGVKDEPKNPFRHPLDVHEDDPFDAASLWRSGTTRSASTLSV